jgi:hypothetical protein
MATCSCRDWLVWGLIHLRLQINNMNKGDGFFAGRSWKVWSNAQSRSLYLQIRLVLRTALLWVITQRVVVVLFRVMLRNTPEQHSSHVLRSGILKSRKTCLVLWQHCYTWLAPWKRILLQKLIVQLFKKFPAAHKKVKFRSHFSGKKCVLWAGKYGTFSQFPLCVGHDCLGTHLHRIGSGPDPYHMLCSLHKPMDRNHLGQCTAFSDRTECERRWETRTKMMENWLCSFSITIFMTTPCH